MELHLVFADLIKAYNIVNLQGLWKILRKSGCPEKLITLVVPFHNAMLAGVQENGDVTEPVPLVNGVKQGCVLAPTLFSILFAAVLIDAFSVT